MLVRLPKGDGVPVGTGEGVYVGRVVGVGGEVASGMVVELPTSVA